MDISLILTIAKSLFIVPTERHFIKPAGREHFGIKKTKYVIGHIMLNAQKQLLPLQLRPQLPQQLQQVIQLHPLPLLPPQFHNTLYESAASYLSHVSSLASTNQQQLKYEKTTNLSMMKVGEIKQLIQTVPYELGKQAKT